jgi:hypothetical protein
MEKCFTQKIRISLKIPMKAIATAKDINRPDHIPTFD